MSEENAQPQQEPQSPQTENQPAAPPAASQDAAGAPPAENADQPAPPAEGADQAAQQPDDGLPKNKVTIEDLGSLKKKLTLEIDRQRIDAKFDELFGELDKSARIPGFRVGHAPRRLIEKRFVKEVSEDVRNALLSESIQAAFKDNKLSPLGDPDIKLDEIKLPDQGNMTFSFEVEVAPEFALPEYKGLEWKRPIISVSDENVTNAIEGVRQDMATLRPTDEAALANDMLVVDINIRGEGVEVVRTATELRVAPGAVERIPLEGLGTALAGQKAGEVVSLTTKVPAGHPEQAWRDKEVTITLTIKEVKRQELPEIDDKFLRNMEFESVEELHQAVRERLERHAAEQRDRYVREQVALHLVQNTRFDLPAGLAHKHASQLLRRRVVDLMQRGVPREQIEAMSERMAESVSLQAMGELRLSFILSKLAEAEGITVEDGEVNSRIAQMARRYGRRPERLRQELKDEGTLDELYTAVLEDKAVARIIESGKVVDVTPEQLKAEAEAAEEARQARQEADEVARRAAQAALASAAQEAAQAASAQEAAQAASAQEAAQAASAASQAKEEPKAE